MSLFSLSGKLGVEVNPFISAMNKAADVASDVAEGVVDLGVVVTKLGGDFEATENAVAVFSGGLASAKRELSEVDKIARDTVGLRMIPAEQGYQRLRSLGFEANRARDFIKELGEEKILSGASDQALEKTIFNFTQIASGGQKVSQEIRELLTNLPSLKRALFDAFGTLDPKKIQGIVDSDPDKFFDRLTESMKKNKAASGGLNDSIGKFQDALIESGRTASKPFLEPLTGFLKNLTNDLYANQHTFTVWGENVRKVIEFTEKIGGSKIFSLGSKITEFSGNLGRKIKELTGNYAGFGKEAEAGKFEIFVDLTESSSIGEHKAKMMEEEEKRLMTQERARQKSLARLTAWQNTENSIYESAYQAQEARLQSHLTNGYDEEKAQVLALQNLRADHYKTELSRQTKSFDKLISLQDGDKDAIVKIEAEKAQSLNKLNTDFIRDTFAAQKKVAEIERDSFNERLKEAINFKRILIDELDFSKDIKAFDIDQSFKSSPFIQRENFDELIKITNESYQEVLRITKESYAEQVREVGLSEAQKNNIRAEGALAEKRLAEQNRRDILKIEENKRNKIAQFYSDLYGAVASGEQQKAQRKSTFLEAVFGANSLSLSQISKTADLIKNKTSEIDKAQQLYRSADNKRLDAELASLKYEEYINNRKTQFIKDRTGTVLSVQPEEYTELSRLQTAASDAKDEVAKFYSQLESLRGGVSDYYEDFGSFRSLLTENLGDETIFDQISAKMLEMEKNASLISLDAKIEQARKIAEGKPDDSKEVLNLSSLLNERGNLTAEYFLKEQEMRAKSVTGLREYIALLQNGDSVATAVIQHQNLTNALREQAAAQEALVGKWSFSIDEVNAKLMSAAANQQGLNDTIVNGILGVSQALESAVMQWDGTLSGFFESLSNAFADMVKQMIAEMIRLLVIATAMGIITALSGGSFSEGFGKVMKKDEDGGGVLGGLFGKKSGSGSTGFKTFGGAGANHGLGGFASGGYTGDGKRLDVAGFVHKGEFVFNQEATRFWGLGNLSKMLNMQQPSLAGFSGGGYAGGYAPSVSNSTATDNRTININIGAGAGRDQNGGRFQMTQHQLQTAVARGIEEADKRK